MRDFAKLSAQFWIGATGREIQRLGTDCQVLALYLITAPNANALGLYYLPLTLASHETGLSIKRTENALKRLCEIEFCAYDNRSETVLVFNMARFQIGEELRLNDKRLTWVRRLLEKSKTSPLSRQFMVRYRDAYHLADLIPLEGESKPLRSLEIESESEIEMKTKTEARVGEGEAGENHDAADRSPLPSRQAGAIDPATWRTQQAIMQKRTARKAAELEWGT